MNQTTKLVKSIIKGLQEKKGKNIVVLDLSKISGSICDYMVIAEGTSTTHVSALSDSVWDFANKDLKEKPLYTNGTQLSEWIGIDYGTVLVHIFLNDLRLFYNLENLWADAKIKHIEEHEQKTF